MRYEVTALTSVDGVGAGGTVDIDDDERAAVLIAGGHIAPLDGGDPITSEDPEDTEPSEED